MLDDVLRSPELQNRLTPSAKRKFKRLKDKPRVAEDQGAKRDV
jgi:hypothetical protein